MNVVLASAMVAVLSLAGCGAFQTDRARPIQQGANKAQLGKFYMTQTDCKSAPMVLKIVKQAENGFAMIEESRARIKPQDTVAGKVGSECAGQRIEAKRVVYTPNEGYSGPDSVKIEYMNKANPKVSNTVAYSINVGK